MNAAAISIVQQAAPSSATVFAVDIHLSDAVAICSYQVALKVSGVPGAVRCMHQSAKVAGMVVDGSAGAAAVAGYSPGGVTFGPAGKRIGTVTITLPQAPTADFRVELRSAELLNTAFEILPCRALSLAMAATHSRSPATGEPSGRAVSWAGGEADSASHTGSPDAVSDGMAPALVSRPTTSGLVGLCQWFARAVAAKWCSARDGRSGRP